jgi:hypothetical protein
MKHPAKLILTYILLLILSLSLTRDIFAFPSSSLNYNLEGEFGTFGEAKTSANYRLTDTGGGFAPGIGESTNYRNCSGFQCVIAEVPRITATLSTNSLNLGTLTTGAVNTQSHTISVTTNVGGYTTTVVEDGELRIGAVDINQVGDGEVTANNEEYGIATSESGRDITQDTSCGSAAYSASPITNTPQSVAGHAGPTYTAETTTLCYAAAINGSTAAGTYQHIVTFITTGSF